MLLLHCTSSLRQSAGARAAALLARFARWPLTITEEVLACVSIRVGCALLSYRSDEGRPGPLGHGAPVLLPMAAQA